MKKILVMNFFPAFFPPQSGGELRYYNMYKGLSRYYDVTLLSPTYNDRKEEIIVHSETFREYRIPKEDIHNRLHWDIDREKLCSEISALVCCLSAKTKNRYHEVYMQLYLDADIIVHEFPYMLYYDLFFGLDNKPRVYNSHNFESKLVGQMWSGPSAQKYLSVIQQAERTLVQNCDLVFATSEEERTAFSEAYGRPESEIMLAPNGIDVALYDALRNNQHSSSRKKAFFIGSAHPPNLEAVRFLIEDVAPLCPELDFYIAGKCSVNTECALPNVHLMGLIDDTQKDELFTSSDIAVNPMFSGAGTNLKTLEFLSAGIPMLSTHVGVRGLELKDGIHYVHAEREDFVQKLKELINQSEKLAELAENGKKFINSHYSWDSICDHVRDAIENLQQRKEKEKPLIFALNDYPVDKPVAGGEVRIHYLLKYLSQEYRAVYLCLNDRNAVEINEICKDFYQISLPKTDEHLAFEQKVNAKCWISSNDIVAGNMIPKNPLFLDTARVLQRCADYVVLEQPYLVDALDEQTGKPTVYDSQNFEYGLKQRMLDPHPMKDWLCTETARLEKKAIELSSMTVCCSEEEIPALMDFSGRTEDCFAVVKNGVEFGVRKYDYGVLNRMFDGMPIAVFVGSGHGPNVDAASFIIRTLAKQTPQIAYVIIGSVCDAFQGEPLPDNVLLMGKLSEEHKDFLLFAADLALNPVIQGAGSNLKLAEYFAYGIPTVTTPFGARGYTIEAGVHAIISERERFASSITALLSDRTAMKEMAERACRFAASELSWEHLAETYSGILRDMNSKKKLLFVTYRYNLPPRGGAEVFSDHVLREIVRRGEYSVDIATTEIGDISNRFHYSCDYSTDAEKPKTAGGRLRVLKFPVDTLPIREKWEKCYRIFETTLAESIALGRKFTELYSQPLLMGGWHFPELDKDGAHIWTSAEAEVFLADADAVELRGHANKRKKVLLLADGKEVKTETVSGRFVLRAEFPAGKLLTLRTDPDRMTDLDSRPLGVYLDSIRCRRAGNWESLNFGIDFRHVLAGNALPAYIEGMIETARRRSPEIDGLFYETRGPLSSELAAWLERHIGEYDSVIGHSTPFDTLVLAQRIAQEHAVPFIALPHFHMEDPFYHWNLYYHALAEADRVIAAPEISKAMFFDKIGAAAVTLPGGGVSPEEYEGVSEALFRRETGISEPFILVLGRKAGGKNYSWVIDAVEEVNRRGTPIRLVMIGRDDDKLSVGAPHLRYLGEQPRDMVLSALKACEFVVNMSESESFGIVILEAWLSGKTVIVNRGCAAFRELVVDGVNGLLSSRSELPDRIEALLRSETQSLMAEAGEKKAQDYSWSQLACRIEMLCEEARTKHRRQSSGS